MVTTQYYSNLLIRQYNGKPKAKATIELLTTYPVQLMNVCQKLLEAFDVETAVGMQLDIVGEYVGQSRAFPAVLNTDLFCFANEKGEIQEQGVGFSTPENLQKGQFLTPYLLENSTNMADDETYRFFIKLKIIRNTTNSSVGETEDAIFKMFGTSIVFFNHNDMSINYMLFTANNNIVKILQNNKKLLPKPTGVRLEYIIHANSEKLFCFANENGKISPFGCGFSTPDNLQKGLFLTPSNIIS